MSWFLNSQSVLKVRSATSFLPAKLLGGNTETPLIGRIGRMPAITETVIKSAFK